MKTAARIFNSIQFQLYSSLTILFALLLASGAIGVQTHDVTSQQQLAQSLVRQQDDELTQIEQLTALLSSNIAPENRQTLRQSIETLLQNFDNLRTSLRTGDAALGFKGVQDPQLLSLLDQLDAKWTAYRSDMEGFLSASSSQAPPLLEENLNAVRAIVAQCGDVLQKLALDFRSYSNAINGGVGSLAILFGIIPFVITFRIARAIRRLEKTTQSLAAGDLTIRANVKTLTELSMLGGTFNHMADEVMRRETELKDLNATLETRVQERTLQVEQTNKELAIATAKAREAARLKGEFLANMSHELRTPLNAIIGFSDMLLLGMSGSLSDKQRHKMERLKENGVRLLTLINDLLDLSRIEAGRMEIAQKPFSPQALADRTKAQMESLVEQTGLDFEIRVSPEVPATLIGDEKRVEQIVVNLLSNAFKFTKTGSVTLDIDADLADRTWSLVVADTGIGIPPHLINLVFEQFRQVDGSYSRAYKGSGLGLAISRDLVRNMDGKVSVKSTLEVGSTFTVVLPLNIEESAVTPPAESIANYKE